MDGTCVAPVMAQEMMTFRVGLLMNIFLPCEDGVRDAGNTNHTKKEATGAPPEK
jgi:hypothetical protein